MRVRLCETVCERERERERDFCTKEMMIQIRSLGEELPLEADQSFHSIPDPLCKLNLRETSEFVKSLPMTTRSRSENSSSGQRRLVEVPSTPGRPVFSFSAGIPSRKSIPSKWDDAEKWLISSSCHESPAHVAIPSNPSRVSRQNGVLQRKGDAFVEKDPGFDGAVDIPDTAMRGASAEVFLKDKFTDNVELFPPNFQCSEPAEEGFQFISSYCDHAKDATDVHHRDIGTEMTPLGSSKTSRCHTPIKRASPARHNTPANRSGPLAPSKTSIDMSELQDCHFAKLQLSAQFDSMVPNWSSREEEEKEVSKSLRHSDSGGGRKSIAEARASVWEEEERAKSCIRYQREEAKIQAWVNLQSAKAEAQSRKLEVKIQKMRSDLEDKLMKRMAVVQRRAEEWRATAQLQHSQQLLRASEQARKMRNQDGPQFCDHASRGCFPRCSLL